MSLRTLSPMIVMVWSCLGLSSVVSAQGLVWKLPEPGTWVRYEGDYTQTERRPQDPNNKDLVIGPWRRHLTIKALERVQQANPNGGAPVEAQWLEFVVETGLEKDGTLVGGPGSRRVYKALVAVDELQSRIGPPKEDGVVDSDSIPVVFLPLIKGYRKFGDKAAAAISSPVFNVHPAITLLAPYRELEEVAADEDPEVTLPGISSATHFRGSVVVESKSVRTTNTADMWYAKDSPFGLVRWSVIAQRETKETFAERDQFETASTYQVEMRAVEAGQNATSLLTEN
ncbi:hypothetical protein [Thalassoroseus pseudoceratinae]|uniref:hypothetical protein n=1 Tax=Thalassoroseus pseudoceratinae TaxID=2713176 RepID=UPI00141EA8CE|nr:hypothetical protein [Thalassoroseus pseudoceratinae]